MGRLVSRAEEVGNQSMAGQRRAALGSSLMIRPCLGVRGCRTSALRPVRAPDCHSPSILMHVNILPGPAFAIFYLQEFSKLCLREMRFLCFKETLCCQAEGEFLGSRLILCGCEAKNLSFSSAQRRPAKQGWSESHVGFKHHFGNPGRASRAAPQPVWEASAESLAEAAMFL